MTKTAARLRALGAWGKDLPDWIEILAEEADRTSQHQVGRRLGLSSGMVNAVLGKVYGGQYDTLEAAVRQHLMSGTVSCPVQGEITRAACIRWRRAPFSAASPDAAEMHFACRACSNHGTGGSHAAR